MAFRMKRPREIEAESLVKAKRCPNAPEIPTWKLANIVVPPVDGMGKSGFHCALLRKTLQKGSKVEGVLRGRGHMDE